VARLRLSHAAPMPADFPGCGFRVAGGGAANGMASVRMNLRRRFRLALKSRSSSRISRMRSNAAWFRRPGTKSQDELSTMYFGEFVTLSPRQYAASVETISPCKSRKSSSGPSKPSARVSSEETRRRTSACDAATQGQIPWVQSFTLPFLVMIGTVRRNPWLRLAAAIASEWTRARHDLYSQGFG